MLNYLLFSCILQLSLCSKIHPGICYADQNGFFNLQGCIFRGHASRTFLFYFLVIFLQFSPPLSHLPHFSTCQTYAVKIWPHGKYIDSILTGRKLQDTTLPYKPLKILPLILRNYTLIKKKNLLKTFGHANSSWIHCFCCSWQMITQKVEPGRIKQLVTENSNKDIGQRNFRKFPNQRNIRKPGTGTLSR